MKDEGKTMDEDMDEMIEEILESVDQIILQIHVAEITETIMTTSEEIKITNQEKRKIVLSADANYSIITDRQFVTKDVEK